MSSIKPDDAGGQVDGGEEIALGLVIAGGDGAELLEPGEEVLDQMAHLEIDELIRVIECVPIA